MSEKIKKLVLEKIKDKKKLSVVIGIALLLISLIIIVCLATGQEKTEVVYKETEVQYGELTVGIENSGSVEIGTLEQTFSLDLSQYVSNVSSSGNSDNGNAGFMPGGGGGMFGQMAALAQGGNGNASASTINTLEISKVCVTTGQEVAVGDVLYELTQDSVSDIRNQLAADVESAKADMDELAAENQTSALTAEQTYDMSLLYGDYAGVEYDKSIYDLEKEISDLEKEITTCEEELAKEKEDLEAYQKEYELVSETASAFEWSVNHMDSSDETKLYIDYEDQRETAQKNAEDLEDSIEKSEDTIEQKEEELDTLNTQLAQAKRALKEGELSAKKTYDLRILSYQTAQETYDVTTGYLNLNYKEQEKEYLDAKEKLDEFDANIKNGSVISEYAGIITEVPLAEGDTITTGTTILTVYDDEDTTITVSVDDSDIDQIEEGGKVNISFTAYDELFTGEITDIEDAETDDDGEITYPVVVTVLGDVSGLYEGMTGDLTFITKQTEKVTFVSNRAITRKNNKSYVKMKTENGQITEKEVTLGFSDGENVEVIEGLTAGDIVLIESKVSGS